MSDPLSLAKLFWFNYAVGKGNEAEAKVKATQSGAYKEKFTLADGDTIEFDDPVAGSRNLESVFENPLDKKQKELSDAVNEINATGGAVPSDPASGGAPQTDPAQENAAAAQTAEAEPEPEIASEEMVVTANRSQPTLRGFTDRTFTLMHLVNLINARNEPLDPEILKMGENDPFTESTLKKLKSPLPAAYNAACDCFATNASIQCYGDPYSFLNYLTAWPGYQDYLDSSTKKLSEAATQIRIFKVFQEQKREQAVEIVFPTAGIGPGELEELVKNGAKRGYGAGIKDLTITLDGTNPITRTRMISASLVIYADSMETLLKPRKGRPAADLGWTASGPDTSGLNYRYADLALRSDTVPGTNGGRDVDGAFGMLDDLDYKLVFEVGLTPDPSANALMAGYTSVSLSLQPVIHSYSIEQDGSITLSIDYKGFIEKEFSNPTIYDVFANNDSVAKDLAKQLGSYYLKQTCGSKAAKSFNENIVAEGNAQLKERVASLMTKMRTSGFLYYVKIDEKVIHAYNTAFNSYEKILKDASTDPKTKKEKQTLSPADKKRISEAFKTLQEALRKIVDQADDTNSLSLSMVNSDSVEKQAKEVEKAAEDAGEEEDAGNVRTCAIDPNNTQVTYFYAGDLINLILRNLTDVYSAQTAKQCCSDAMKILESDPIFKEVLGTIEGVMGPGGTAENLLWQIESNPWNLEGDLKQTQVDDRVDELFEAVDDIQNKYADTLIGMEQIKRNFAARFSRFEKLRIVLGPTMFNDFFTENKIMCSIGDIPIALNHFNSWLASEIEGKDKHRMGLADFLDKFINQYLRGYLMGDMKTDLGIIGQKKSYTSAGLVAYNPMSLTGKNLDVLTGYRGTNRRGVKYEEIPQEARPILDTSGNRMRAGAIRDSYDYLVFHEKHTKPVFDMMPKNSRVKRSSFLSYFGISMFQHGRDRGILKTAEYQTTNIQGLKEARYQSGKFNGLAQLAEVFDVTLNCYADLQMYPGNRLYLDPKSLVPFLSKRTLDSLNGYNLGDFGIGGFYVVNSVQHSFAQGKFETTIRAQWEQWQKEKPKKKNQSEEKYNEFTQKLNEPIKKACKTGSSPDMGDLGDLYETAEEIARSIFGDDITDTIVGYIKGMQDIATSFFDSDGDDRDDTRTTTDFGSAAEFAADQTTSNMFPKESNPNRPPPGQVVHDGPNLPQGYFKDFNKGEHKGETLSEYAARKEATP
jgi:hypothetical protein